MGAVARKVIRLPHGARVIITCDVEEAQFTLQVKANLLKNIRPLLAGLAGILREEARDRFTEGGRNPQWQRLADSTVAAKAIAGLPAKTGKGNVPRRLMQRGRFGPGGILIGEGRLRDAWGVKSHPDHIEIFDVKRGTVTIAPDVEYAAAHQKGTNAYVIMAKAGKALAFTGGGGAMVFASKVNHPGLPQRAVTISQSGVQRMREMAIMYLEGQRLDTRD